MTWTFTTVKLDTRELDRIARDLGKNTDAVIKLLAFQLEQKAKSMTNIDTSALRNSIFTKTNTSNNFSAAKAAAEAKRPGVRVIDDFPEPKECYAIVGSGVEYAFWQEVKERGGKPYIRPAAEAVGNELNKGKTWEKLFKR